MNDLFVKSEVRMSTPTTFRQQTAISAWRSLNRHDVIRCCVRFDDQCGNGYNSFSITGEIKTSLGREVGGGTIHAEIRKAFPEIRHLLRWHFMSSDGPMHYIANTVYHAGNRDHDGLLKGERKQIINGKTGMPSWRLVGLDESGNEVELHNLEKYRDQHGAPVCPYTLAYRPWYSVGEGKERDFDAARKCAIWPEATDEQLLLPADELKALLIARAPLLMLEFQNDIATFGFAWSPTA